MRQRTFADAATTEPANTSANVALNAAATALNAAQAAAAAEAAKHAKNGFRQRERGEGPGRTLAAKAREGADAAKAEADKAIGQARQLHTEIVEAKADGRLEDVRTAKAKLVTESEKVKASLTTSTNHKKNAEAQAAAAESYRKAAEIARDKAKEQTQIAQNAPEGRGRRGVLPKLPSTPLRRDSQLSRIDEGNGEERRPDARVARHAGRRRVASRQPALGRDTTPVQAAACRVGSDQRRASLCR